MQRLEFRAMGCQMLAVIDSAGIDASKALAQVPGWFEDWESSLSRFRENSELSALNRADGNPVRVSATLWQVIHAAMQAANESDGLVVPTLLDAVQAAGYDRSFESLTNNPMSFRAEREISDDDKVRFLVAKTAPRNDNWRAIELDETNRTVRLPRGMRLDFGGVAKGWAADQAAHRLGEIAPALMDAGGDIALSGSRMDNEPWTIGVADPFKPDSNLDLLMVQRGGVATSGRDYRKWQRNGKWQHHIIDPRIGAPAETDVLSATVIAPTTQDAEVAAKAALILGSRAGIEWIEARENLAGLLVLDDGQVIHSSRLHKYFWSEPVEQISDLPTHPLF